MQHLDEGTIHSWLDGALGAEEARGIEAHLAECPSCASAVAEARGLIAASSRVLSALDVVPADVIPGVQAGPPTDGAALPRARGTPASSARGDRKSIRGTRSPWLPRATRIAAVVTVAAVGATLATRFIGDRTTRSAKLDAPSESISPMASSPAARPGVQMPQVASTDSAATRSTSSTSPAPRKASVGRRSARGATQITVAPSTSEPAKSVNAIAGAPVSSVSIDSARPSMPKARADAAPAAPSTPPVDTQLRLVASERVVMPDARVVQRRIYEVRPGVRVTLEEATTAADHLAPVEKRGRAFAPAAAPTLNLPERAASADSTGFNSIRWSDSTGTQFTLTGRLTIEELRRLKGVVH